MGSAPGATHNMLMLYLLLRTIADHAVSQGASRVSIEAQVTINNGAVSGDERVVRPRTSS